MKANQLLIMVLAAAVAAVVAGCSEQTPGTTRLLGPVGYEEAFATARDTMSQYFSVEDADVDTGDIVSRPKPVDLPGERALGGDSPARQLAVINIRRRGSQIRAHASVAIQRQAQASFRHMSTFNEDYDTVPDMTPAEVEAATTPEQNQAWNIERYDHALERKMLADIQEALKGSQAGD